MKDLSKHNLFNIHKLKTDAERQIKLTKNKTMAEVMEGTCKHEYASKAKAMEIMDKAERWSGDMRKNASAYVENVIKDTDETLTRSVNDIRTLRQSLRDALNAGVESRPNFD